jgi:lipoyl(octanoyl) transferase
MACDEALLLATGADEGPRLRFYYWPEPTISLGYFQEYDRFQSTFPNLSELTLVRRLTGGGAILHDREITYCLTIPAAHPLYKAGPVPAYVLVHQAIADVFKTFGIDLDLRPKNPDYARVRDEPEFCFSRPCPTDLICPAGKLVGSAQRRLPQAFLQHGSIILENRFITDQPTAALVNLLPAPPKPAELEKLIAEELAKKLEVTFTPRDFTSEELGKTKTLILKYTGSDWTIHRRT